MQKVTGPCPCARRRLPLEMPTSADRGNARRQRLPAKRVILQSQEVDVLLKPLQRDVLLGQLVFELHAACSGEVEGGAEWSQTNACGDKTSMTGWKQHKNKLSLLSLYV